MSGPSGVGNDLLAIRRRAQGLGPVTSQLEGQEGVILQRGQACSGFALWSAGWAAGWAAGTSLSTSRDSSSGKWAESHLHLSKAFDSSPGHGVTFRCRKWRPSSLT